VLAKKTEWLALDQSFHLLEIDLQIPVQDCAEVAHGENDLLVWLQALADDIEWLALYQRFDLFFEIGLQSTSIIESPNALEAFMVGLTFL
jgi:hypothetical protein